MSSPLRGRDATRDRERDSVQAFSMDATHYAKQAELGALMTEMLTEVLLNKPEKPVDFLIELLTNSRTSKVCVCAPPGVPVEQAVKAVAGELDAVAVSVPPLLDESRERIMDGKTVEEHAMEGAVPDQIIAKLVAERLNQPDCQAKGWVLENCPVSKLQAQRLIMSGHLPGCVISISAPDDVIVKQSRQPQAEDEEETEEAQQLRKSMPSRIAGYRKNMAEMEEVLGSVMEQFDCSGINDLASVMPAVRRKIARKVEDPGVSKKKFA
eukprot:TRINITY_DN5493_c0_g1_i1.p1 TRINITY_DN5493_c0_g1~~TRINITY_DN5493_c0_g1_i1.p1  ORF type:complete len:267 (+),score=80.93 TRINITY_DN5493_c0_g1_i1:141-941(+)